MRKGQVKHVFLTIYCSIFLNMDHRPWVVPKGIRGNVSYFILSDLNVLKHWHFTRSGLTATHTHSFSIEIGFCSDLMSIQLEWIEEKDSSCQSALHSTSRLMTTDKCERATIHAWLMETALAETDVTHSPASIQMSGQIYHDNPSPNQKHPVSHWEQTDHSSVSVPFRWCSFHSIKPQHQQF